MTKPAPKPGQLDTLPPSIAELIKDSRLPVDTDSPVEICQRLAVIEDDMARLQPALAEAAFRRLTHDDYIDQVQAAIKPEGANAEERKHSVAAVMQDKYGAVLDERAKATAAFRACEKAFEVLDSRRSILQSMLKLHLREQEPKHGQGAGQTGHLRNAA